jgi:hypothetical protein
MTKQEYLANMPATQQIFAPSRNITLTRTGAILDRDATEADCINFVNSADKAKVHLRLAQGDILLQGQTRFGIDPMNIVGGDGSSYEFWTITLQVCRFFPPEYRYEDVRHFDHYRGGILYGHSKSDRDDGKCLLSPEICRQLLAEAVAQGHSAAIVREKTHALIYGGQEQASDKKDKADEAKAKADAAAAHQEPEKDNTQPERDEADEKPEITVETVVIREVVKAYGESVAKLSAFVSHDKLTLDEIAHIRRINKMFIERVCI